MNLTIKYKSGNIRYVKVSSILLVKDDGLLYNVNSSEYTVLFEHVKEIALDGKLIYKKVRIENIFKM